ncbi:MAG: hypothetical protein H8D23_01430 [Candidatus Brocadiales bacterium]|nr:hypothetical protein [Candidatus Brocadiales bacterium]
MSQRITVVMSDQNNKKLREIQSKWIKEDQKNWSFSKVLDNILDEVL